MKYFTFYWRDGSKAVLQGFDVAADFNSSYGRGALAALDFYTEAVDFEYFWNKASREWERKIPSRFCQNEWDNKTQEEKLEILRCSEYLCSDCQGVGRYIFFRVHIDPDLGHYFIADFKEDEEPGRRHASFHNFGSRYVDPDQLELLIPFIDRFFAGKSVEFQTMDQILTEKTHV